MLILGNHGGRSDYGFFENILLEGLTYIMSGY
jgi:hypothetical protein